MPDRVRITDVSPRDGLQNEPGIIPTADKARLIELLCATGVDEIEVTSFVSAKWVPQLGDAAELCVLLRPPLPEGGGWGVGKRGALSTENVNNADGLSVKSAGSRPPKRWSPPPRQPITMDRAKALRKAATGPEHAMWAILGSKRVMGAKFRRQHPFGPYILDFFCQEYLLAIELDGHSHASELAQVRDAARDEWVRAQGVTTLRFSNNAAIFDPGGVAAAIQEAIQKLPPAGRRSPTPQPPPSGRGGLIYSALVPNDRGMQSLLDANRAAGRTLIAKASVFTAASEAFARRNTNASIAETLERFVPVIHAAHDQGLTVRGYISCVIACPFAGPTDPDEVANVAAQLRDLGVDELDLGDTIGAATPESTRTLLHAIANEWPIHDAEAVTLHLHDTFGRAADCVNAALEQGVRSFDGSVAGLGGCPYASTPGKPAPGNISTELLVRTIRKAGYETGVNDAKLSEAAAFARDMVMKSRSA